MLYRAEKVISSFNFSNDIPQRTRINKELFTTLNTIMKLSPTTSIKLRSGYHSDQLRRNSSFASTYKTGLQDIEIFQQESLVHYPILYHAAAETTTNFSPSTRLAFTSGFSFQNDGSRGSANNNGIPNSLTLSTRDIYQKYRIDFSHRLSEENALTASSSLHLNSIRQGLTIITTGSINERQIAYAPKSLADVRFEFLSGTKSRLLKLSCGFDHSVITPQTFLFQEQIHKEPLVTSKNDFRYVASSTFFSFTSDLTFGKISLTMSLETRNARRKLTAYTENNSSPERSTLMLLPRVEISYPVNKTTSAFASYEMTNGNPGSQYMYESPIRSSYRINTLNSINLDLLSSRMFMLGLRKNDLFNLFNLIVNLSAIQNRNTISNRFITEEDATFIQSFRVPEGDNTYLINFRSTKYISGIHTTIGVRSNHSIHNYRNMLNSGVIRINRNFNSSYTFTARTGFQIPLNIETEITLHRSYFSSGDDNENKSLTRLINTTHFVYKPIKDIAGKISANIIQPNSDRTTQYCFLDASFEYSPSKKRYSFSLTGVNLLNIRQYKTYDVTDYLISLRAYRTLERYILLGISWQF